MEESKKKEPEREELQVNGFYGWSLTAHGSACRNDDGEPNNVISEWDMSFEDEDENPIGKIDFKVVNQGEATNRGEDFYEVYDAEDSFHCDYYEHVADREDFEELLSSQRVILLVEEDLTVFQPAQRFDVLQIIEQVFADVVIVVRCDDSNGAVAAHLATVLNRLPNLPGEDPKVCWLYHISQYRWWVKALSEVSTSSDGAGA